MPPRNRTAAASPVTLRFDLIEDSPIGPFGLAVDEEGRLVRTTFDAKPLEERTRDPAGVTSLIRAYFEGDMGALDRIEVAPQGTQFELQVWSALRSIRPGETWSYARLARHIGRPTAMRAVGLANGKNPIPVVVPCHRVIGSDGSLTGFGGGLPRKRWLLDHELPLFQSPGSVTP